MATVSLIIPFVVAYIAYFWRKMDKKSLTNEELETGDKY
jgi:cytochrome d ubiquinol oxidase subunit II